MTPMEKKKAVDIFVDRVVICDNKADVHLCFSPDKTAHKKGQGTTANADGSSACGHSSDLDVIVEAKHSCAEPKKAGITVKLAAIPA